MKTLPDALAIVVDLVTCAAQFAPALGAATSASCVFDFTIWDDDRDLGPVVCLERVLDAE